MVNIFQHHKYFMLCAKRKTERYFPFPLFYFGFKILHYLSAALPSLSECADRQKVHRKNDLGDKLCERKILDLQNDQEFPH